MVRLKETYLAYKKAGMTWEAAWWFSSAPTTRAYLERALEENNIQAIRNLHPAIPGRKIYRDGLEMGDL